MIFFPFRPQNKLSSASFFWIWWKRENFLDTILVKFSPLYSAFRSEANKQNLQTSSRANPTDFAEWLVCHMQWNCTLEITNICIRKLSQLKIRMLYTCSLGLSSIFTWYRTEDVLGENVTYPIVLGKQPLKIGRIHNTSRRWDTIIRYNIFH